MLRISHQIAQLTAVSLNPSFPPLYLIRSKKKSSGRLMIRNADTILPRHPLHLNQPFLPTLSTSAPKLLGVDERSHRPTSKGFANAFSTYDGPLPSLSSSASAKEKEGEKIEIPRAMMKSMRDIELVYSTRTGGM